jgi:hypothetical protein
MQNINAVICLDAFLRAAGLKGLCAGQPSLLMAFRPVEGCGAP